MPFEVVEKSPYIRDTRCTLLLSKRQVAYINSASMRALGKPTHILLLFDPETRTIGIQPSDAENVAAYTSTVPNKGESGGCIVSSKMLVRRIGLDKTQDYRFEGEMVDGVLCFKIGDAE